MPRRQGDTAAAIVQIASQLFAKNGFSGTGVAEISKALGVTNAALYYHFESKQALLFATLEDAFSGHLERLEAIVAGDDAPSDKLRRALDNYLDLIFGRPDAIRVFLRERRFLEPQYAEEFQTRWERYDQLFDELIAADLQARSVRDRDPRLMRLAVQGMLSAITEWYEPGGWVTEEEIRHEMLTAITGRLLNNAPDERSNAEPRLRDGSADSAD